MIEARLLELAHTTDAKLTAPALAYFAGCSIADAGAVLDDLATRGTLTMEVADDGSIVYELPGRQRLVLPRTPAPRGALVPAVQRPARHPSPVLAAFLTVWVPGAGHLYAGRFGEALMWFLVVGLGYVLIVPGLVLHLFAIAHAAVTAQRISAPVRPMLPA